MKKSIRKAALFASVLGMLAGVAEARVCFIVGGCDSGSEGDKQQANHQNCDKLGYSVTKSSCEQSEDPDTGISYNIAAGGVCYEAGVAYYESCVCNPEYYQYAALSLPSDKYEVTGQSCKGRYHSYRCKNIFPYVNTQSDADRIGMHNGNVTANGNPEHKLYEANLCIDNMDVAADSETCTELVAGVTRYASCGCNKNIYKYSKTMNGYDDHIFTLTGKCEEPTDGDIHVMLAKVPVVDQVMQDMLHLIYVAIMLREEEIQT
mgnify:CR=1 FL=1